MPPRCPSRLAQSTAGDTLGADADSACARVAIDSARLSAWTRRIPSRALSTSRAAGRSRTGRNDVIDALKYFAIALVILTHVLRLRAEFIDLSPALLRTIVSFNLPLFTFLSGWVLYGREGQSPGRFMRGKALGLLVPYFAWIAVEMPLRHVVPSGYLARLWHAALDPMAGMQMWFLWALFWMFAVFTVGRLVSRSDWWTAAIGVAVGSIALLIPGAPAALNRIAWLYPYLVLGYLVSKHRASLRRFDVPATAAAAVGVRCAQRDGCARGAGPVRSGSRGHGRRVRNLPLPAGAPYACAGAARSAHARRLRCADGGVPVPHRGAGLARRAWRRGRSCSRPPRHWPSLLDRFAVTRAVFLGQWPRKARG